MAGSSWRIEWKTPLRLVATTRFQSSTGYSPVGLLVPAMPALLTARWRAPKVSTANRTPASTEAGSVTSIATAAALAPVLSSSAAALRALSSS